MSQENGYLKGLFIGLLAGSAAGAFVALLYAPKSGKELQNDIRNKKDEYYDKTEKFISDARDNAKSKSNELLKNAERIFTEAKNKTGIMFSSGKEVVDDEITKLKTAFDASINVYKGTKNKNDEAG
jgi:gas vesicle protein